MTISLPSLSLNFEKLVIILCMVLYIPEEFYNVLPVLPSLMWLAIWSSLWLPSSLPYIYKKLAAFVLLFLPVLQSNSVVWVWKINGTRSVSHTFHCCGALLPLVPLATTSTGRWPHSGFSLLVWKSASVFNSCRKAKLPQEIQIFIFSCFQTNPF